MSPDENQHEPAAQSVRDANGAIPADLPPPGQRRPSDFWLNRFRVDLGTGAVAYERVRCEDLDDALGGCARGFKLLDGESVPDAYAPEAPLIMNLGVLSGTEFMTGLRTYFHAFSPLKSSRAGAPSAMWTAGSGKFGTKLRHLDVDEVIFTGRAEGPVYLHLSRVEDGAGDGAGVRFELRDAADLHGVEVNDKIQTLHGRYPDAHFAVIGPAGENYEHVRFAAIALSTENQLKSGDNKPRFCGRGGIGGVLGSKNVLAIVADTKDVRGPKPPKTLKELNQVVARGEGSRRFRDKARGNGGGGTWANVQALHPVMAMPEMNFQPTGDKALSQPMYRPAYEEGPYVVKDEACYRCGIRCHKNVYDENEDGSAGRFRAKLDYEPLNLLSSNLGIFDQEQCCELVELGDQLGMDSISLGTTLAYAMEYNKRHPEAPVAGGLAFGDYEGAMRVVREIGEGRLAQVGQGTKRLSEETGETGFAMHCKGMEFPAYLPQTNPGYPWALAGGHMSMRTYLLLVFERETDLDYWVEAITERGPMIMRDDVIGICKFAGMTDEHMAEAIGTMTGLAIDADDLRAIVRRTYLRGYRLEQTQGFGREDYVMPSEIHAENPAIELPYFNTEEFFAQLAERVCGRFDELLEAEAF
ncbi:MAG: aldehyde ferredoxin oxidoreductase C-terminal domain-containing protein [Planctomycetota bacterium]